MMKFNSRHVILCFLMGFSVLLVGVSSVCAHDLGNITNLNNNDIGNNPIIDDENNSLEIQNANNLSATSTFDDLQAEINNATEGSVLNLTRDYNGVYGSRIQFNKNLTIDGQGHTLDCLNAECSAFYSNSGNITLMNLKIINGHNDDNAEGGAIHIDGSAQYTIINCTFNNNWADNYGGAIYNSVNKALTIINSTFDNNKADDDDGGAIYTVGDVYIENSIFKSNTANEDAGAIFCYNAYITNCLFDSNNAGGAIFSQCEGGAIYCTNDLTIDNSTFKNNYATDYGGAAYAKNINVNNNQDSNQPHNSFFINNKARNDDGGALYSNGDSHVKNAIFTGNNAENEDGGAIYCTNDLTIDNSIFKNNHARDRGGAAYANNIYINNNQVSNQIYNSFFINNTLSEKKGHEGGALYSNGDLYVKNAILKDNKARKDGGAIFCCDNTYITHCLFESNKADGSKYECDGCGANHFQCEGGAIYCKDDLTIDNCTFNNNFALDYGGAINADTITWVNTPSYFISNYVIDNQGGAIYTNKFNTDVSNAVFIDNKVKDNDDGGAIYINKENHITFSNCIFKDNKCGDEGGAIYLDSSSSDLTLKDNSFMNNHAGDEGQVVFNKGTYGTIENNWWGTPSPDFSKDLLVEWKFWKSNIKHKDSNPLKSTPNVIMLLI